MNFNFEFLKGAVFVDLDWRGAGWIRLYKSVRKIGTVTCGVYKDTELTLSVARARLQVSYVRRVAA